LADCLDAAPVITPAPVDLFSTSSRIPTVLSPRLAWVDLLAMSQQTDIVSSTMPGVSKSPRLGRLACPACDNDDPNAMLLFAETIETDSYSFDRIVDGVPVFAFGKSVETESGPVPPSVQCSACGTWWTPAIGTYELR
jgi:hypothetical protein